MVHLDGGACVINEARTACSGVAYLPPLNCNTWFSTALLKVVLVYHLFAVLMIITKLQLN